MPERNLGIRAPRYPALQGSGALPSSYTVKGIEKARNEKLLPMKDEREPTLLESYQAPYRSRCHTR